jgi:hypothetical protein
MPCLIQFLGASWHITGGAWSKSFDIDILPMLSPVFFGYIAFLTYPKTTLNPNTEPSTAPNGSPGGSL